jgi:ZIP family zinc transporter
MEVYVHLSHFYLLLYQAIDNSDFENIFLGLPKNISLYFIMNSQDVLFAFGLTLFAGLSTGVGSLIALFSRKTNNRFLAGALGFSAGVMIYVSFIEIFAKSRSILSEELGNREGYIYATLAFFGGIALIAIIDKLVPSFENPHEPKSLEELTPESAEEAKRRKLLRMGLFSALAIGIHNFPEGMATFIAALNDPALGISIAVAIAIHNIPEGIAVSVPIYFATGSRKKAFFYSFLSGLAEPVGAAVGYLILAPYISPVVFGLLFAAVAGIMVFISLDQLMPTAEKYGEHHIAVYGLVAGMALMAVSLLLFA